MKFRSQLTVTTQIFSRIQALVDLSQCRRVEAEAWARSEAGHVGVQEAASLVLGYGSEQGLRGIEQQVRVARIGIPGNKAKNKHLVGSVQAKMTLMVEHACG